MNQISSSKLARYLLEIIGGSGLVPCGGLLSAVASVWADKDQDRAGALLDRRVKALAAASPSPSPIFSEDDYYAEIAAVQRDQRNRAERINRPRLLNFRRHALDRQVEAMIYNSVYKNKVSKIKQRKEISDRLYELEVKELNLRFDALVRKRSVVRGGDICSTREQRNIQLQKLEIKYGKFGERPSAVFREVFIVAR